MCHGQKSYRGMVIYPLPIARIPNMRWPQNIHHLLTMAHVIHPQYARISQNHIPRSEHHKDMQPVKIKCNKLLPHCFIFLLPPLFLLVPEVLWSSEWSVQNPNNLLLTSYFVLNIRMPCVQEMELWMSTTLSVMSATWRLLSSLRGSRSADISNDNNIRFIRIFRYEIQAVNTYEGTADIHALVLGCFADKKRRFSCADCSRLGRPWACKNGLVVTERPGTHWTSGIQVKMRSKCEA